MAVGKAIEKIGTSEVEDLYHTKGAPAAPVANADYSGAVAKSDKAEIALVRKLDWRIMPTLWAMYFLCVAKCRTP